jgi:hypothetical protein
VTMNVPLVLIECIKSNLGILNEGMPFHICGFGISQGNSARIVDEDIDSSKGSNSLLDSGFDFSFISDITLDSKGLSPSFFDFSAG